MANEAEDHRESVAHMMSEFFRELAALVLVFVPLDYLLKGDTLGSYFWYETAAVLVFFIPACDGDILRARHE
jgi:hypothetical protein